METGVSHELERIVKYEDTALYFGSGNQEVFATPVMIAIMEDAAQKAVLPYLEQGQATVGTKVNIKHVAATGIGKRVTAKAVLKEINGKRLVFDVEAFDEVGKIGFGEHERFIIDTEKFMEKTKNRG